jgi:hypothetical protein
MTSFYAITSMSSAHYHWQRGGWALVRINLGPPGSVPRGCLRMPSITANPKGGSIVCAATLTRIW